MNLIEKLGLEKCKRIVDGAPAIANFYIPSKAGYTRMGSVLLDGAISLNDLRTAIAEHDQHWYGQSEEKELEQYSLLQQEKIEGGAALVGDFTAIQEQLQTELNNCSAKDSPEISITDDCTDIRNHISPLTGVIER